MIELIKISIKLNKFDLLSCFNTDWHLDFKVKTNQVIKKYKCFFFLFSSLSLGIMITKPFVFHLYFRKWLIMRVWNLLVATVLKQGGMKSWLTNLIEVLVTQAMFETILFQVYDQYNNGNNIKSVLKSEGRTLWLMILLSFVQKRRCDFEWFRITLVIEEPYDW